MPQQGTSHIIRHDCPSRLHVDAGSPVYVDVMKNTPVCSDHELLMVDMEKSQEIFPYTDGTAPCDAGVGEDVSSGDETRADDAAPKRKYSKRGTGRALFRQTTTSDHPCLGCKYGKS